MQNMPSVTPANGINPVRTAEYMAMNHCRPVEGKPGEAWLQIAGCS